MCVERRKSRKYSTTFGFLFFLFLERVVLAKTPVFDNTKFSWMKCLEDFVFVFLTLRSNTFGNNGQVMGKFLAPNCELFYYAINIYIFFRSFVTVHRMKFALFCACVCVPNCMFYPRIRKICIFICISTSRSGTLQVSSPVTWLCECVWYEKLKNKNKQKNV